MVRCRWCLEITSAGFPDKFHINVEKECPNQGKVKPYDGLDKMFGYTDEEVNNYRINTNNYINDDFPEYYKYLEVHGWL